MTLKILLGAGAVLFAPSILAQPVSFPDPALEQVVREYLQKPSGDILRSDMLSLKFISAQGRNVRNLEGLQFATNLEELKLISNLTTNYAPLAQLGNLHYLTLISQGLKGVSFLAGLPLIGLDIWDNQIADITPLNSLVALRSLQMGHNPFATNVAALNLPNLESLSLPAVPLKSLNNIQNPLQLTVLNVAETGITNLQPILNFANLNSLEISGNLIPVGQVALVTNLPILVGLGLFSLGLPDVEFLRNLPQLKTLGVGNNPVLDWTPIGSLTGLEWLNLDGGRILNLSVLVTLSRLQTLSAGNCGLTSISDLRFIPGVRYLYLSNNKITDFSVLNRLVFLRDADISGNLAFVLPGTANRTAIDSAIANGASIRFLPQTVTSLRVGIDQNLNVHAQGPAGGGLRLDQRNSFSEAWMESGAIGAFDGYTVFFPARTAPMQFYRATVP